MVPPSIRPNRYQKQGLDKKEAEVFTVSGDNYETRVLPYYFIAPVMWILALYVSAKNQLFRLFGVDSNANSVFFDRPKTGCRYLRKHSPTSRVLHFLYNYESADAHDILDHFWLSNCNAQAVRNRKKLAKSLLEHEIRKQASNSNAVRILSLASGSAQAVIESVAETKNEAMTKVMLVDIDPAALSIATAMAHRYGIADRLQTRQTSIGRVSRIGHEFEPDIVEMIGFLDYLSDAKAEKYFDRIFGVLESGGSFLTCNIHHNFEMPFIHFVADWPMIYRRPERILRLLKEAGFKARVAKEPHEIHGIATGIKPG
jgi:hypothetical protein